MPETSVTIFPTLRGRLAGSMLAIFLAALAVSTLLDRLPAATPTTENEPAQDALVLAGCFVPALILIWLIASWSLRPLARASEEAGRIGPRDPAARLSRARLPAEILPLVDAVNGALDRMANAFAAERRFTENAAHELRTPLAVLGLRLQRARAAAPGLDWPEIDRDLAQMNRLVAQLLDLARKENAGRTEAPEPVNLARLAREAAAMVLPLAQAQGRELDIDLPDALPMRGQADDLRDALRNLLENAALHGQGNIGLSARIEASEIVLAVTDQGDGIAEGEQDAVFGRFHKHPSSTGTGLGLAIVREVVRNHGGEVAFLRGSPCVVELRLRMGFASGS
jgi:two-component system sensor histidine kinase QseC